MKKFSFILVFSFFILAGGNCSAEVLGIALDQTVIVFDADQGETQEFSLTATNISTEEQIMLFEVEDLAVADENEMTLMPEGNELFGMKDWVEVKEKQWLLAPGESRQLVFTLNVPLTASVGSHFSAILLRAYPLATADNFQKTIVSPRVGVHLLVNVKGEISGKGKIKKFSAPIFSEKNVTFKAEYQNEGNVHYIPHGEVSIKNLLGQEKENLQFEKHFVFPGKKFSFELNWGNASFWGAYRAEAFFVDGNGEKLLAARFIFGEGFFILVFSLLVILLALGRWVWRERKKTTVEV
jgi:hypothetical protein